MSNDLSISTVRAPIAGSRVGSLQLGRAPAFWVLAATLALFLLASSAPSPLYVVYQEEWGFSAITLTSVFAVYAIALLAALLVAGSLSDHVGRRVVLLAGLMLEIVAMLVFAEAEGVAWLFAARTLQGVATGLATGAISAALLDLQPGHSPRRGALLGVAAPMTGLASGALGTGLLVEYAPAPTRLVFWLLVGLFALATVLALALPETVARAKRWRHTLRPEIAVPVHLRGVFFSVLPSLAATWALGGLILSLGPSLTAGVLGQHSHVAGGLPIFLMAGISAVTAVLVRDVHARTTARGGLVALITGVAVVLVALHTSSLAIFLAGTAIAGLGFGPAFAGTFRAVSTQAPVDQRAALVSAILAVSYLAFSVPAILAGVAVNEYGLRDAASVYALALIAVALVALALSHRLQDPQDV